MKRKAMDTVIQASKFRLRAEKLIAGLRRTDVDCSLNSWAISKHPDPTHSYRVAFEWAMSADVIKLVTTRQTQVGKSKISANVRHGGTRAGRLKNHRDKKRVKKREEVFKHFHRDEEKLRISARFSRTFSIFTQGNDQFLYPCQNLQLSLDHPLQFRTRGH
jgi:hypothetical protein